MLRLCPTFDGLLIAPPPPALSLQSTTPLRPAPNEVTTMRHVDEPFKTSFAPTTHSLSQQSSIPCHFSHTDAATMHRFRWALHNPPSFPPSLRYLNNRWPLLALLRAMLRQCATSMSPSKPLPPIPPLPFLNNPHLLVIFILPIL